MLRTCCCASICPSARYPVPRPRPLSNGGELSFIKDLFDKARDLQHRESGSESEELNVPAEGINPPGGARGSWSHGRVSFSGGKAERQRRCTRGLERCKGKEATKDYLCGSPEEAEIGDPCCREGGRRPGEARLGGHVEAEPV